MGGHKLIADSQRDNAGSFGNKLGYEGIAIEKVPDQVYDKLLLGFADRRWIILVGRDKGYMD